MPQILPSITKIDVHNNSLISAEFLPEKTAVRCIENFKNNPIRTLYGINDRFFKHFLSKWSQPLNLCPKGMEIIKDYNQPVYNPIDIVNEAKNFYKKSSHELAQQYISNPHSLSEGELERLKWEADLQDRALLENNIPKNNPIIIEISQRLKISLNSKFSILK